LSGQSCEGTQVTASLRWESNTPNVQQRWIDLSTVDNGWLEGTYASLDVSASADNRVDWRGLPSRTYHYARLNQQVADGAWETSGNLSFETRLCGNAPSTRLAPAVLGFTVSARRPESEVSPPGSTMVRSCGEESLYAYLRYIDRLSVTRNLESFDWLIDGVSQPHSSMTAYIDGASVVLLLPLGGAPVRPYAVDATLRFPRSDSPAEATIRLVC
jgi:hypothetical protein